MSDYKFKRDLDYMPSNQPKTEQANMDHRLGMQISLSAILAELDNLNREINSTVDFQDRMSDVQIKQSLGLIEKYARFIMVAAQGQQSYLADRLNRHAVVPE